VSFEEYLDTKAKLVADLELLRAAIFCADLAWDKDYPSRIGLKRGQFTLPRRKLEYEIKGKIVKLTTSERKMRTLISKLLRNRIIKDTGDGIPVVVDDKGNKAYCTVYEVLKYVKLSIADSNSTYRASQPRKRDNQTSTGKGGLTAALASQRMQKASQG
jgi:hypothetical protein